MKPEFLVVLSSSKEMGKYDMFATFFETLLVRQAVSYKNNLQCANCCYSNQTEGHWVK